MNFNELGFKKFVNDFLVYKKFSAPTLVQQQVIPLLKKIKNVVAIAPTGTGKTHSFLLPILNNLNYESNNVEYLVLAPTRELATQIYDNIKEIAQFKPELTVGLFISGVNIEKNKLQLHNNVNPKVVIATPKKVIELYENGLLKYTTIKHLTIDEYDMMFANDFIEDIDYLMSKLDFEKVNVSLFSATKTNELNLFLKKYFPNVTIVDLVKKTMHNKNVVHNLVWIKNANLYDALKKVIESINPYLCLIFINKVRDIPLIKEALNDINISQVGELHSDLPLRMRSIMQKRIKANDFKYIIVSDIAARGIDFINVSHVISLDFPNNLEFYIHRSGRTGRGDQKGEVFSLLTSNNEKLSNLLLKRGIEFNRLTFESGRLIHKFSKHLKKPVVFSVEEKIVANKFKTSKIKPGYRKKIKLELSEIKRKKRRELIKQNIEKIKKEKYKKRRDELFS